MLTDDTVAEKPTLVAPEGTSTEAGTATALLLLLSATLTPPDPAAAVSVTVQASLPAPVIELLAQVTPLNTGVAAGDKLITYVWVTPPA